METVKAYKGFDKDLKCRGFQYESGKTYEMNEDDVKVCESGFHACTNPFDILDYYGLADGSRFCEVEAGGKIDRAGDGSKIACSRISIGKELGIKELVRAVLCFSKKWGKDTDDGDSSQIASAGNWAKIASAGNCSKIASGGDWAKIVSGGDCSQIVSAGEQVEISSEGEDCVICCTGNSSKAKAKKGSWITLAEWKKDRTKNKLIPVCVKTEFVDGEKIKSNTWYTLKDGRFTEAEEKGNEDKNMH